MTYSIDGTTEHGDLDASGASAPFRIFDSGRQDWIGLEFSTREEAEMALAICVREG